MGTFETNGTKRRTFEPSEPGSAREDVGDSRPAHGAGTPKRPSSGPDVLFHFGRVSQESGLELSFGQGHGEVAACCGCDAGGRLVCQTRAASSDDAPEHREDRFAEIVQVRDAPARIDREL